MLAWLTVISNTTPYCFLVNPFIKYSSLQLSCLSLKSTFWHKTCSVTKSDTWTIKLERFRKFRIHSSLVDWVSRPSNILWKKKTIPLTSFYCIFHLVWIPMTTTKNTRGYRGWKNFFHEVSPFKCILIFHTINSMALAILGYTTPWLTNIGNKHLVGQSIILVHTTWNIKWQKCAGISGLWVPY